MKLVIKIICSGYRVPQMQAGLDALAKMVVNTRSMNMDAQPYWKQDGCSEIEAVLDCEDMEIDCLKEQLLMLSGAEDAEISFRGGVVDIECFCTLEDIREEGKRAFITCFVTC